MKKKILAVVLCLVTLLSLMPLQAFGVDTLVVTRDGLAVRNVTLTTFRKLPLQAEGAADGAYQWQIRAGDLWVNIQGADTARLELSYAMVSSLLTDGKVDIRCTAGERASAPVTVTVDNTAAPEFDAPAAPQKAPAMRPSLLADGEGEAPGVDVPATHSVVIHYVFADGRQAASPYTANVAHGSKLNVTVNSPAVLGYTPSEVAVTINETVNADITRTVTYNPALVNYTVKHYQQNVGDDTYYLWETENKQGYTESEVGKEQGKEYEGFYALLYDPAVTVAADGSTVVEIYYDRYYYLMNFDLDGGYGVEPIYARYGAPIEWKTPVKQGYSFTGWEPKPDGLTTMPAGNRTFMAQWKVSDKVKVTVVFWGENPNDEGYSYHHSGTIQAEPGKDFTFAESDRFIICGQEAHTHDENCAYGCGKAEHSHSGAACGYACGQNEHHHSASCYTFTCTQTEHTHSTSCYANVGDATSHIAAPNNPKNGQIYKWDAGWFGSGVSIYINGTWYKWTGNANSVSNGQIMPATCGKTEHTHTGYTGSCYTLTCGEKEHTHSASCGYACGQEAHTHSEACGMSCGKTEHQHTSSCYQTGAGMDSKLWKFKESQTVTVAPDGSSIINVYYERTERTLTYKYNYSRNSYQVTKTITAKWGADISKEYTAICDNANTTFWSHDNDGSGPYTNYFGVMPANSQYWTYYHRSASGSNGTMYYYGEGLNGGDLNNNNTYSEELFRVPNVGGYSVTDEDRYEFEGFTYHHGTSNGSDCSGAKFYYSRNSYKLEYISSGTKLEDKTATVKYQAPLTPYNITPPYPDNLEPNAYAFGGWYDDPYFQQPTNWNSTMPASDRMVYAKWVPVTHTVTFALDKNAQPGLHPAQTVTHGNKLTPVEKPTNGSYTFIGWFYDDNGTEKAFDTVNMPVNRDLKLYGKWSASTMVPYTIRYAIRNEDGTLTYIADDLTGSALALTTKTFEAKTGTALYDGYQFGYFPEEASHSIVMSAAEGAKNEFTFIYVQKEKVPYTVRYLEKGTNKVLHEEKTVETPDAIVTETFVPVTGYRPDAYQKRLVLSAKEEENVITFWYVKDDQHAPLHIVHYVQNIQGDGYTVYQESTDINAEIGKTYDAYSLTIPGFVFNAGKSNTSGEMTAEGLELTLYYDREKYAYEFRFLEQGTNKVLANPIKSKDRYQAQVSATAQDIPGYDCITLSPQAMIIQIENGDEAVNNVRIFYYTEKKVTIHYQVVGPDGCGTVTPSSETIKVKTDVAGGSVAVPSSNVYKFVGWFQDEACTQPVDLSWISGNHITPQKTGTDGTYEAATYYAKFDYNLTSLTIRKEGTAYDPNDRFIFDIYDKDNKRIATVVLQMGAEVTISGLTVGETYTVKERTAGTRYEPKDDQSIKLQPDKDKNTVTFTNDVKEDNWLTSTDTAQNEFKPNPGNP